MKRRHLSFIYQFLSACNQVEGAPVVVKKGLKKEEAEELQKKLEAVGAKIVLE